MLWRCVRRVRSARKFLFNVIVGASVFAAAPVGAQAPDPAKDVTDKAKALKTALDKLKPGEIVTPPLNQRDMAELATAISKAVDSKTAATTWAATLTDLVANQTRKPDFSNEGLRKASRKLADAIDRLSEDGAPAPLPSAGDVNAQAAVLASGLEKLKPGEGQVATGLGNDDLAKLSTTVAKLLDPTFAVTVWANDLAVILVDRRPKVDADLRIALQKIAADFPGLEEKLGPYLNIVQAWFGDLYYIRRATRGQLRISPATGTGFRVCEATNEVRSACQGKPSCPFKPVADNAAPPQPDIAKLCAEHPVPFASHDIIGVAIEFQCLHATRQTWNRLENNWQIEDAASYPTKMVMLRAATEAAIRCTAELPTE